LIPFKVLKELFIYNLLFVDTLQSLERVIYIQGYETKFPISTPIKTNEFKSSLLLLMDSNNPCY